MNGFWKKENGMPAFAGMTVFFDQLLGTVLSHSFWAMSEFTNNIKIRVMPAKAGIPFGLRPFGKSDADSLLHGCRPC